MYCPSCGTENENAARFCKGCGAELGSTAWYDGRGRDTSSPGAHMGLGDAVYRAIEAHGMDVLGDPKLLKSLVTDFCDQGAAEYRLFEYNCDPEFLGPFRSLVSGAIDDAALDDAANRAYLLLCARAAEMSAAEETCRCMRNAIARFRGLPEVASRQVGFSPDGATEHAGGEVPHTTRMDLSATTQLSRSGSTVMTQHDASGIDRMPDEYLVDGTAPLSSYPAQVSVEPPRRGVSRVLVAVLVTLIAAVGGVSYALLTRSGSSGGASLTSDASPSAGDSAQATAEADDEACTVEFFSGASDATGRMDSVEVDKGNKVKLPSCGYARSGYAFDGWLCKDGKEYSEGDWVKVTSDTSFTATWKLKQSTQGTSSGSSSTTASGLPSNPTSANQFPLKWSGTYTGFYNVDDTIERQLLFEFSTPSATGDLSGVCYVGVSQTGSGALYGDYYVTGTVNWNTGEIHLKGTSWIVQGGLADLREYEGTVNFSAQTMSGTCYDVGTGAYRSSWQASSTSTLNWNTNTGTTASSGSSDGTSEQRRTDSDVSDVLEEVIDKNDGDDGFPTMWTGSYDGWTSHGDTGDDTISRSVAFYFDSIGADGSLSGYCYVGVDDAGAGATQAGYYISGHVDWDSGKIHVEGTSWIEQGGLDDLRQYDGTVDFESNTMSGTASDVGTGAYPGDFYLYAV